jgi:transposase
MVTADVDLLRLLEARDRELEELSKTVEMLREDNERLGERLKTLLNALYGRKSERIAPGQLDLFTKLLSAAEVAPEPAPSPDSAPAREPAPKRRSRKGHGRNGFPAHLPRLVTELDLPEGERTCPDCGVGMRCIGEESCERGHVVPAQILVHRYVRKKYACPAGHAMKTAEAPAALIERCKYEPSVYAHIAVAKYSDHLPLHRQSEIFKRYGIDLSKSTMWDMLGRVDELVSQPVLERMRAELLLEKIIQADETPVTVRLEGGKGTQQSYVWVYRAGAKIAFDFRMGRDRDGPNKYLALWQGILQGDGYSGYDEITRRNCLTRAGCWAHARRKVKVALDLKSPEAARLMVPIQRLFRLESTLKRRAEARGYSREEYLEHRSTLRRRRSASLLAEIDALIAELKGQRAVLPKGPLGKAIGYIENQREPLGVFVNEPRLEIDNNQAENALRPIAVGRKNWLVFGSPRGGAVACRLYSLVLSCRAAGLNPELYLEAVLRAVATTPATEIASLTPWAWAEAHPEHRLPSD